MRHFILISKKGRTAADWSDLMHAGRLDIVCHAVISALYTSNDVRDDVTIHISLNGPPIPPLLISITYHKDATLSKKDIGTLIKMAQRKHRDGKRIEVHPGVHVEKKSWQALVNDLADEQIPAFYLDEDGSDIAQEQITKPCALILGDHDGFEKNDFKFLKTRAKPISIGKKVYFTSQVISFLNIWLDRSN
jgi:tRNA (pseudouridine54-N1)-methyltransferase